MARASFFSGFSLQSDPTPIATLQKCKARKACTEKPPLLHSTSAWKEPHQKPPRRCHKTRIDNRAREEQTTRTGRSPMSSPDEGPVPGRIMARSPEQLPDPWLFDSEKLLNELGRITQLIRPNPNRGFARHALRDQSGCPSDLRLARTSTILAAPSPRRATPVRPQTPPEGGAALSTQNAFRATTDCTARLWPHELRAGRIIHPKVFSDDRI